MVCANATWLARAYNTRIHTSRTHTPFANHFAANRCFRACTILSRHSTQHSALNFCRSFEPAVYVDGQICLDLLQSQWSPIYDVGSLLTSIQSLLSDPNPASPANAEAAALFQCKTPHTHERRVHGRPRVRFLRVPSMLLVVQLGLGCHAFACDSAC